MNAVDELRLRDLASRGLRGDDVTAFELWLNDALLDQCARDFAAVPLVLVGYDAHVFATRVALRLAADDTLRSVPLRVIVDRSTEDDGADMAPAILACVAARTPVLAGTDSPRYWGPIGAAFWLQWCEPARV